MNSVSIVAAFYLDSQMDRGPLGPLSEGFQFPAVQQLRLPPRAALAITSLQIKATATFCALLSLTATRSAGGNVDKDRSQAVEHGP